MNPKLGWLLATLFAAAAYRAYGWSGLAFAASATVFWLLLQFNRSVRVMKNAAGSPLGHVNDARAFAIGLSRGMTLLQVVARTHSLGRKAEGDDVWCWADESGTFVRLHFVHGRLARWQLEHPAEAGSVESAPPG